MMEDNKTVSQDAVTEQAIKSILNEYVGGGKTASTADKTVVESDPIETAVHSVVAEDKAARGVRLPSIKLSLPDLSRLPKITPKRAFWAIFLAIVILRPMWIVLALLLSAFFVLGAFLTLGADRIWHSVSRALETYQRKRPEKAARLRARLDRIAVKWDSILDRCPEGLVDGLYFPDFSDRERREAQDDAIVNERLLRLREQA